MTNKLLRLKEHIDFLAGVLGRKGTAVSSDFEALVQEKFRLMKELKCSYALATPEIVTNKTGQDFPALPFFRKVVSQYSHQDLLVETDPTDDFFYALKGTSIFTNSGQAATNLSLLFIFSHFPGVKVKSSHVLYHEARDYLNLLKKISRSDDGIKASYIDSTTFNVTNENLDSHFQDAQWIVVDSTCWEMRSPEMNMIINRIRKENLPAFIVRSHVKLDALGAEYGLLGSLFFFHGNLSASDIEKYQASFRNLIAINRCAAGPCDLYPFWRSNKFSELSHARTEDIRSNTRKIEEYLQENYPGHVTTFAHGLYCTLEIPYHPQVKDYLLKSSRLSKVPFLICDSFGFDQLSITYIDSRSDNTKVWLRLAGSDLEQDDLMDGLAIIKKTLEKLSD